MFWDNFWPNFFANLVVDGLIVGGILFILERHFNYKDRKTEEEAREKRRKENLRIAVNMLWAEIEHNRKQSKLLVDNLGKRPKPNIIFPALETSAWEIVDKNLIFEGLNARDFSNLLKIYNRVYTINRMYYKMLDKIEWILLGTDSTVRREYVDAIIDRSNELLDFIEEVIPKDLVKQKTESSNKNEENTLKK
jgi:hypothetical protein